MDSIIDIVEILLNGVVVFCGYLIYKRATKGRKDTKKRIQEIEQKTKEYEQNN